MRDQTTVITGATGFLGRELVLHMLAADPAAHLTLLVRGRDEAEAQARGLSLLTGQLQGAALADASVRVAVVRADLERDRLGLTQKAYDDLAGRTTAVIHGAASVSFSLPIDEARAINVEGTRRILGLARQAGAHLDYVGTAYVAGERTGLVLEAELECGQGFRNTYERSKCEAEALVRSRAGEQSLTIYRPSIIVGDSRTGRTASFKVLYWPLKIFARGFRVVPGRADTPMDVVPSDFVVQAIAHLRQQPGREGQVYHLCAGPERSATLGALAGLAAEYFHVRAPFFVQPRLFVRARPLVDRFTWGRLRRILVAGRVYTPYLSLNLSFDTRNQRAGLAGSGIEVPRVEDYFANLFRFAIETDWGKKLPGGGGD
ncbi:SDR family oxidoreductase [Nannocystis sp.]|uniref:SDR family oxidoreductase n=1 Tax=Nannocystis sp. TaxID=1962667 RepID=UPI0025D87B0B|nr:SDR family oxidoreductase [Nannocystis sp.]MBK7827437.1 SDR family oxidoreductase [Nannocystis sp.]